MPKDSDALPPALDLEWGACEERPDGATFQREVTAFIQTVEREVGKRVVLYATPSFTATYPGIRAVRPPPMGAPAVPRPEAGRSIWQVSRLARVQGIGERVDLNVWREETTDP